MQQQGKYIIVKCTLCGECYPVHIKVAKRAKYCTRCKNKAYYHPGPDASTKRARREAMRRQSMLRARLAARDKATPPCAMTVHINGRLRIERRGIVPIGAYAPNFVSHNS